MAAGTALLDRADHGAGPGKGNGSGTDGGSGPAPPTPVRRRRALPNGRAVVGGFLVAAAAVATFAAQQAGGAGDLQRYVVVTRAVEPGELLDADALAVVELDLPGAQRRVSFADPAPLVGATALGALEEGQLVQTSDVVKPYGGPDRVQLSIPVDPARALNGELRRGDTVDVLVTFEGSGRPVTETVSAGALVVDVVAGDATIGGTGDLTVELAVPPADVRAVAGAGAAGTVTLARTTGLQEG